MVDTRKRSKEYFSESEYGVKASPRVAFGRSGLQRGGGRDQLGKPYKVRGRMYYPKEDKNYRKVGQASWYGDAFHGRLTANGEIYDMTHLTAAHPTMPLPSYARVTNLDNGSSVVVRVNDRGPYSHNRLIDLSSRAADLLDYKRMGTAKVRVEYLGRAPLEGRDDNFLLASYRPGKGGADPSDGLPAGVMMAMNGRTPTQDVPAVAAFPATPGEADPAAMALEAPAGVALPSVGPVTPERPEFELPPDSPFALSSLSYADEGAPLAAAAFGALAADSNLGSAGWKDAGARSEFVAAASLTNEHDALALAQVLGAFGRAEIERSAEGGVTWYSVNLYADGRGSVDAMLEAAWANGAADAIAVRRWSEFHQD